MKKVHIIEEEIEKNPILDRIWIGENSAPNCSVYHSYKMIGNDIEYLRKGIEREETIKEVCEWLNNNVYSYSWCDFLQHEKGMETGKLIKEGFFLFFPQNRLFSQTVCFRFLVIHIIQIPTKYNLLIFRLSLQPNHITKKIMYKKN